MECLLILMACLIAVCNGSGKVSLQMIRYYNPGGRGSNGHPCDGKFFFSGSDCDHRFIICLDESNGPNSVYRCPYGRKSTNEVSNTNNVYFGSSVGGVSNPMLFPFAIWQGSIKIKVEVWDSDDNGDDHVDFLHSMFRAVPYYNASSAHAISYTLSARTTLWLKLKVYCDSDFYGESCATFCRPRDDSFGHYSCDPKTGSKICLHGWQGTLCHVKIDHCQSSPCLNGATCLNSNGGFVCVCQDGYNGTLCEFKNNCFNNPCENGGRCIVKEADESQCDCIDEWTGPTCSLLIPPGCRAITVKMDKNLGREELEAFEDKIKIRVASRFNVDQADVYLNVNSTPNVQKEENVSDTLLSVRAFVKSRAVCFEELQPLLTEVKSSLMTGSQPRSGLIIQKTDNENWLSVNWYVVVVAVASAVLFILIIVLVLKKRKQKTLAINGSRRYNVDSDLCHLDEANGFTPITFENSLYATVQPDEQIRVSTRYDFDDS